MDKRSKFKKFIEDNDPGSDCYSCKDQEICEKAQKVVLDFFER